MGKHYRFRSRHQFLNSAAPRYRMCTGAPCGLCTLAAGQLQHMGGGSRSLQSWRQTQHIVYHCAWLDTSHHIILIPQCKQRFWVTTADLCFRHAMSDQYELNSSHCHCFSGAAHAFMIQLAFNTTHSIHSRLIRFSFKSWSPSQAGLAKPVNQSLSGVAERLQHTARFYGCVPSNHGHPLKVY